ncbi:MAG: SPOR domain-containing protein [Pseudomonadales bacterium]|nr:SPOR domain-containing protein [Pseudomonadales bacterium]
MNEATKQRLAGALILGSLAIIFVPVMLDGEGLSVSAPTRSIPAAPEMPPVPTMTASRPAIQADSLAPTDAAATDSDSATVPADEGAADAGDDRSPAPDAQTNSTAETPVLNEAGLPSGWSVRLGLYAQASNAQTLLARLQRGGYKAYIRPAADGSLSGVFVGPVLSKTEAQRLQQQLHTEFGEDGIVVDFVIDTPSD